MATHTFCSSERGAQISSFVDHLQISFQRRAKGEKSRTRQISFPNSISETHN